MGKTRKTPAKRLKRPGRATRNAAVNAQTRRLMRTHYAAKYRVN